MKDRCHTEGGGGGAGSGTARQRTAERRGAGTPNSLRFNMSAAATGYKDGQDGSVSIATLRLAAVYLMNTASSMLEDGTWIRMKYPKMFSKLILITLMFVPVILVLIS